jgi:hypothetical protein
MHQIDVPASCAGDTKDDLARLWVSMATRDNAAPENTGPLIEPEVPEDEASRESFPASDPPSAWAGEEFAQPDPPPNT